MNQHEMRAVLDTLEMARDALTVKVTEREMAQTKTMLNLHILQMQRELMTVERR
ncbi:hypothetical protein QCE63_32245 [Caballeronia sp. LZ065]|uniref:hypothetical protein n=1 Tax=Caballeronia sp. LZ065 TaxID=3038571 RepID=UPI00285F5ED1|nr:hypothetical protein [Caballeronia sp. LZ065]MDR5784093.1 hypothetical protein [Caballeronia sp. LZ065]